MKKKFEDFKQTEIYVDEKNNLAIFSMSEFDGFEGVKFLPSIQRYELKTPYSPEEVAKKIESAMNDWCKYDVYTGNIKKFEESYYGIRGFKNATKGKKLIQVGWNDIEGKYASLLLPCKTGNAYLGIEDIELSDDAGWIDFALAVLELINLDLNQVHSYKVFKSKLNV